MAQKYLIKNIHVVNEGRIAVCDVLIADGRIEKIEAQILQTHPNVTEINGEGKYLLPGAIDDQVHFREPGLTAKATIYTESKAAVAGGVTSFMEMPNTQPPVLTQALLEEKYSLAAQSSLGTILFTWALLMIIPRRYYGPMKRKTRFAALRSLWVPLPVIYW
jgi:dihydroorotase